MKNMKAYVLFLGDMHSDSNYIVMGDTGATPANPTAPHRLLRTPSTAVLINHPEAGWILFDTGMTDDPESEWPNTISGATVIDKPEHTRMERQLELVGVKPKDVKHVIMSHMHMDHIGNDKLFADTADFYVGKEEAAHAFRMVLQSPEPSAHGWYVKSEVLVPRKKLTYIDRDEELFPGVHVITLPGHTPCVLGLVLHLEGGTLIFSSDAVNERRNLNGQVPGSLYDSLGYAESIRKVKELQKKYNAQIFFSHDEAQISEIKLAPEYYE